MRNPSNVPQACTCILQNTEYLLQSCPRVKSRPSQFRVSFLLVFLISTALFFHGQTFTTLASFNGLNGANPMVESLVQGLDGNFYGITGGGGLSGHGVIFRVTPQGTVSPLYNFCKLSQCTDGASPSAGLILGRDGNLYGTTVFGGTQNISNGGNGTIFKVTIGGALSVLHSFCGKSCSEGINPSAPLLQAKGGSFFGTTVSGGKHGYGTVFSLTPQNAFNTIYSFCSLPGCSDGATPTTGLAQASNGKFYGRTDSDTFHDTFYSISSTGVFNLLYTFCPNPLTCTDGTLPAGELAQGSDDNFYGVNSGGGTIYEITPQGDLTTLYTFCKAAICPDGSAPRAGLVLGTDGKFYGTSFSGGTCIYSNPGCGTIFKITPQGSLTTLHSFCQSKTCPDGLHSMSALVQGTDGSFYGLTYVGGAHNKGTVFKLNVGLKPFVRLLPAFAKAGAKIIVYGTNLSATTSVTFNGKPASFTIVSPTQLKVVVPSGATTGKVKVTTPTGTLLSNVAFQVL